MQSILHTPTNQVEASLDFYKKLNFDILSDRDPLLVSDGKAVMEINPDRFARAGIKLYQEDWSGLVDRLKKHSAITAVDSGYVVSDPNGVWVYLVEGQSGIDYERQESCFGLTGNFSGISIEATDMARSAAFWEVLGFSKKMGEIDQGWATYANEEGLELSLMGPLSCPHLFFNPSLNYFNGDNNLQVIQNIRKAGIPITEEITYFNKEDKVDNIIIRDPGGYGFFLFSD